MTKVTFEGLFTLFQESKPIYHPQLLKQFFLKGHMTLVLKILCRLYNLLKLDIKKFKIPSFCDLSLEEIVAELKIEVKDQQSKPIEKPKKDTAASLFDNMFSFDEAEEDVPLFGKKKKKEKEEKVSSGIEEEFEEVSFN